MKHAQPTKSLFAYGAGLLSLSLGAAILFFTLQPRNDSLQDFEPEAPPPRKVVKVDVSRSAPDVRTDVSSALDTVTPPEPVKVAREEESPTTVEVLEPGRIKLSADQVESIKGRGASWGQDNSEADAVLRSIPKEAFTSDW